MSDDIEKSLTVAIEQQIKPRRYSPGRPKTVIIDPVELYKMSMNLPTQKELAAYFQCNPDYFQDLMKERPELRAAYDDGMEAGRLLLRQTQMSVAVKDRNTTMLIWLGKNNLDQSDKSEISGKDGKPIQIQAVPLGEVERRLIGTINPALDVVIIDNENE